MVLNSIDLNSIIVLRVTINYLTVVPESTVLCKVTGYYNLNDFKVHISCFMNHISMYKPNP